MATTQKHNAKMALRLQPGLLQSANEVYGGSSSAQTLGAGHQIAWDEFGLEQIQELDDDQSVESGGFEYAGNQTALKVPSNTVGGPMRYEGIEPVLLAAMGYERPTPDGEEDGFSPESLGSGFYSHVFEIDKHDRHNAAYRTAPDLTGITQASISFDATDRKNRAMTIGIAYGTTDHRYKDCMATSFSISGSASDGLVKWSMGVLGFKEERADYSSSNWTLRSGNNSAQNVLFRHLTCKLGAIASRSAVDIIDFNFNLEIPIEDMQSSESGEFITEPYLNDKYKATLELTLARHEADTWRTALETPTAQSCSFEFTSGSYGLKILFENLKITNSNISGDGLPKQKLVFQCGPQPSGGTDFSSELGNHVLVMDGPVVIHYTSKNSDNWLRLE